MASTFTLSEEDYENAVTSREGLEGALARVAQQAEARAMERLNEAIPTLYNQIMRTVEADNAYNALVAEHPEVQKSEAHMRAYEAAVRRHNHPDIPARDVVNNAYAEFSQAITKAAAIKATMASGKKVDVRPGGGAPAASVAARDSRGQFVSTSSEPSRMERALNKAYGQGV